MTLATQTAPRNTEFFFSGKLTHTNDNTLGYVQKALNRISSGDNCIINLSAVEYMDSSSLGGLIVLKEKARARNINVILRSPQDRVRKLLDLCRFHQLFTIEA